MDSSKRPTIQERIRSTVGPDVQFSEIKGFEPTTFDFRCRTTNQPCGAKLRLISQYTRDITKQSVESGVADDDAGKLRMKLHEYAIWSAAIACEGSGCVIRQAMDESTVRQTAVSAFRKTRNFLQRFSS